MKFLPVVTEKISIQNISTKVADTADQRSLGKKI